MEDDIFIIREPKTFYFNFDQPKDLDKNLKYEIEFIIICNESSAQNKLKMRLNNYCQNISMETIFMDTKKSKANEPHKFVLNVSQRLLKEFE